ncbi:MAG TPA: FecR family protein [Candidatus Binatia bacterium]|nr:FecR family protein [Candidatus Binatia bacterium]
MMRLHSSQCHRMALGAVLLVTMALLPRVVRAEAIGSVVTLEGQVEVVRAGISSAARIGDPVELKDEVRTGRPGRARLAFRDDSVLNVADDSHVVLDEQVYDPGTSTFSTAMRLLSGKVRTLVSEYYQEPRARFEVQTPTSVSGVRGTEFLVVYDPERQVTEVVGVSNTVAVRSVLIPPGDIVYVTTQQITSVARGQYPTPPRKLEDAVFRQYLDGVEFIGAGQSESLVVNHPLVGGSLVPPPDRAGPVTASMPPGQEGGPPPLSIVASPTGAVPGDNRYETPDVGTLVQQPPSVVEMPTTGDVGVPF